MGRTVLTISLEPKGSFAALEKGDEVLAAVREEYLSRVKGDSGFPWESVRFCLEQQSLSIADLDLICLVGDDSRGRWGLKRELRRRGISAGRIPKIIRQPSQRLLAELSSKALGPSFSEGQVQCFLDEYQITYMHLRELDMLERVSKLLLENNTVAWFQGPMDFQCESPRHRIILMRDPTTHETVSRPLTDDQGILVCNPREALKVFSQSEDVHFLVLETCLIDRALQCFELGA